MRQKHGHFESYLPAICVRSFHPDICNCQVQPGKWSDQFCQVTGRSIIVNTEIVSDISNNDQLIITSSSLKTTDYNDPNLGFYFDEGSGAMAAMMAEARCNAGTGEEMSEELNLETGVAATFSCFLTAFVR